MPEQVALPAVYRPEFSDAVNLLTYQDVIDHLLSKEQATRPHSLLRTAIKDCYETDLPQKSPAGRWKYYLTEQDLRYNKTYNTGTITYDHTGGSSERLLTFSTALTGDPLTNLARYRIRISDLNYEISNGLSSTTCQLSERNNPGADIAAGTSFTLYRTHYPLPVDFVSMYPPLNESVWSNIYFSPREVQWLQRHSWSEQDEPERFTIMADPDVFGQMNLVFEDAPSADGAVRFLYWRTPRALKYHGYEEDILNTTASGTGGTQTITLSSATIAQADWVGRLIRLYDTSNHPTGLAGRYPFKEQAMITAVSGATITVASNLANTHAASTKYRLVDIMDVRHTMKLALLRGCEWQLDVLLNRDPSTSFALYEEAVRSAGESDDVVEGIRQRMSIYRNRGWTHAPVVTA